MRTLGLWLGPEALGRTLGAGAVYRSLWQWWPGRWRPKTGVVLVFKLLKGQRLLPWRRSLCLVHQGVWDFFFTPFQGNPSKPWRSCPFWKRPRAVKDPGWSCMWPLGWCGSPNAPRNSNYHPWCHHSDQATLISVRWGYYQKNKINKHFILARWTLFARW